MSLLASRLQQSCAALPWALLPANMPGFYHIANLDSETAFQEDLLFSFHLFISFSSPSRDFFFVFFFFFFSRWTGRFTPQEYSAAAPASVWLNQWVRSENALTLSLSLSPGMSVRKEDKRKALHWLAVDQPQDICWREIGYVDMINGLQGHTPHLLLWETWSGIHCKWRPLNGPDC